MVSNGIEINPAPTTPAVADKQLIMKKKILTFCCVFLAFIGMGTLLYFTTDKAKEVERQASYITRSYTTIIIEGCEYITYSSHHIGFLAHKGNCKNHFTN